MHAAGQALQWGAVLGYGIHDIVMLSYLVVLKEHSKERNICFNRIPLLKIVVV